MSLINDMLRNLENSQRRTVTPENFIFGMTSSFSYRFNHYKKYLIIITLLSVVAIGLVIPLLNTSHVRHTIPKASTPLANAHAEAHAKANITSAITLMTGITLQMQHNNTYLRFLLSQSALYQLSSNLQNRMVTITLDHTKMNAELPKVNYAGSGIEAIESVPQKNGDLKINIKLNPSTDVERLQLDTSGKAPELQLDLLFRDAHVDADNFPQLKMPIPVIVKRQVDEGVLDNRYLEALNLHKQGSDAEAIAILNGVILASPVYHDARALLVEILVKQGRVSEAQLLLDKALKLTPVNTIFVEQKAKLLLDQGKERAALHLLEQFAPPLTEDPAYHSFIAALYQQLGMPNLAASVYKQLITLDQTQSKWWLGLGVSLEEMGKKAEASQAYANANRNNDLSPEVKAYVDSRASYA